ncbi:SDR family NAD(P)-dependent oxidoreductase [Streptosporangium sp. NPDC023963]|uniref:SDR family NAD(P)-dependent oxidoreductase n=1 Tax=Streptosporangium sp. NPDC023963 TaxID=3155608 RepID=UPI0034213060
MHGFEPADGEPPDGPDGLRDFDGPDGFGGSDGRDDLDGPDGFGGLDGPDRFGGPDGFDGHDGHDGHDGSDGLDGPDGFGGLDGSGEDGGTGGVARPGSPRPGTPGPGLPDPAVPGPGIPGPGIPGPGSPGPGIPGPGIPGPGSPDPGPRGPGMPDPGAPDLGIPGAGTACRLPRAPVPAVRTGGDVVFMFPGGGTWYPGMGRELYRDEPVFRAAVDECLGLLPGRSAERLHALWADAAPALQGVAPALHSAAPALHSAASILQGAAPAFPDEAGEIGVPPNGAAGEETGKADPSQALPAVFVMEMALARLLMARGVSPSLLMGSGLGEYAAACVADVMSLRDALAVVARRGELLATLRDGATLAVPASEREVEPFLGEGVCLSAVNGPASCVLAGPAAHVAEVRELLDRRGIACRLLPLGTAAHSALVDPVIDEFRDFLGGVPLRRPSLRLVSGVTGTGDADFADPEYWVTHLRATVRFDAGLGHVLAGGPKILVEVGPGTTLTTMARARAGTDSVVVNVTRHPAEERTDGEVLLGALARLREAGVEADLPSPRPELRLRPPVPPHPFAPTVVDPPIRQTVVPPPDRPRVTDPVVTGRERSSGGLYGITWKRAVEVPPADPGPTARGRRWILLSDSSPLAEAIAARLEEYGAPAVVVTPGRAFHHAARDRITIDPRCGEDYEQLLKTVEGDADGPSRIVCLWGASLPAQVCPPLGHVTGLARALSGRPESDLCLVTRGALEITGGERLDPRAALTLGAAGPLRHELTGTRVRLVDLDPGDDGDHGIRAGELLAELCRPPCGDPVGLRAGHRWLRGFEPLDVAPGTYGSPSVRRGGTYVITGGTGGIGLRLAGHLAAVHSARLVLIGHEAPGTFPPYGPGRQGGHPDGSDGPGGTGAFEGSERSEKSEGAEGFRGENGPGGFDGSGSGSGSGSGGGEGAALRAFLVERGGDVLVRGADVADARRLREVLEEARSRFGEIHGVIHAAGVPGEGMAEFLTEEGVAAALRAKTEGTAILVSVLREVGALPDFVVLFSSLASFSGGPGLTCHGAAGAFLDTFALGARRDGGGVPVLSIDWDRWNGVGTARDTERRHRELPGESLPGGLSPEEGPAFFEMCLAALSLGQVVVSSRPPGDADPARGGEGEPEAAGPYAAPGRNDLP